MTRSIAVILAATGSFMSAPATVRAELPPSAYEKSQASAPESLTIKIQKVSRRIAVTKDSKMTSVRLSALVTKVRRTATALKRGKKITITYDVTEYLTPWVGPSPVTIPAEGDDCPAYLERDPTGMGIYHPAAGGYTFRELH